MQNEILYMLGIVATGFAINYALRALPFILFAGRDRTLPPSVEKFGAWISPIIIACLVVYSYTGLAWRTPGPFVAGAVTVGLQLWKRNPLASIVVGTVIYMCFLNLGCTTAKAVSIDAKNPSIEVKTSGIYVGNEPVKLTDVPEILDDAEIPKTRAVHILLDSNVKNLTEARTLMGVLAMAGYTRSVLVTKQHGDSANKSGNIYTGEELMRHEDVFFTVTRKDVRFGLLTPVEPNDIARCLQDYGVQRDQQIRICGQAQDFNEEAVIAKMFQLEDILRKGGYLNVKRFWLEDTKSKGATQKGGASAHPNVGGKRTIRYRGANE